MNYDSRYFKKVGKCLEICSYIAAVIFFIISIIGIIELFIIKAKWFLIVLTFLGSTIILFLLFYFGPALGLLFISHANEIELRINLEKEANNLKSNYLSKSDYVNDSVTNVTSDFLKKRNSIKEIDNPLKVFKIGARVASNLKFSKMINGNIVYIEKDFEGIITLTTESTVFIRFDKYLDFEIEVEKEKVAVL